jgi:hypothetical protein
MDELTIKDRDGDEFALSTPNTGEALLEMDSSTAVRITESDAIQIMTWLTERFGIGERVAGFGQSVTITVPGAAGGPPREVSWRGDSDAPAWLRTLGGRTADTGEEYRLSILRSMSAALREAGFNPEGDGLQWCDAIQVMTWLAEREELYALRSNLARADLDKALRDSTPAS